MRNLPLIVALALPCAAVAQPVPPTPAVPSAAAALCGNLATNWAVSLQETDALRAQLAEAQRQLAEAKAAAKPETKP
ncbi:MAG TPA: hypothetical protein VGH36_01730 [Acetobacteraceae bacterium]|jgi:hypothetical protein